MRVRVFVPLLTVSCTMCCTCFDLHTTSFLIVNNSKAVLCPPQCNTMHGQSSILAILIVNPVCPTNEGHDLCCYCCVAHRHVRDWHVRLEEQKKKEQSTDFMISEHDSCFALWSTNFECILCSGQHFITKVRQLPNASLIDHSDHTVISSISIFLQ